MHIPDGIQERFKLTNILAERPGIEEILNAVSPKFLVLALVGFLFLLQYYFKQRKLKVDLPYVTVGGGPFWFRSWRTSIEWIVSAKNMMDKGYYQYKDTIGAFQVPTFSGNHVFICQEKLIDELRHAPDEVLSFGQRTSDILQAEWTMGTGLFSHPYHVPMIRNQLTKSIESMTIPMMEEFAMAIEARLGSNTGQWQSVKLYEFTSKVLASGMNRTFVGLGLCRNEEYLKATLEFTQQLFIAAHVLQLIPRPLKYLLSPVINEVFINKTLRVSKRLLAPMIVERKRRAQEEGNDWKGKPNDMLQWLIDGAPEPEQDTDALVRRMAGVSMAALHTTTFAVWENLIYLAMYPQHIPEIRKEIETTIAQYGWTKTATSKMVKLDSFMRETMRLGGPSVLIMGRTVLGKGFTFSNGLHVPPGVAISIPETIHLDDGEFENAKEFDGFRFSRPLEEDEGAQGLDNRSDTKPKFFTTTSMNYLRLGHGHGSCPGRFFAAQEIKIILSLLLMNYDIRLEDTPKPITFTMHKGPDMNCRIGIRRRTTA